MKASSGLNMRLVLLREAEQQNLDLSFSTLDLVDGFLDFQAASDTVCSKLNVSLRGVQDTTLMRETASRYGQTNLRSTIDFLKLEFDRDAIDLAQDAVLRAGKTYRIAFRFLIPQQIAVGFARHWPNGELLKAWHLLLPPSTDDITYVRGRNFLDFAQANYGNVHYSIVATVFGPAASDGTVLNLGQCERRIQVRPRPWQINLLDNTPFHDVVPWLGHTPARRCIFTTGVTRKRLGELSIEPSPPGCGHQFVGTPVVPDGSVHFSAALPFIVWFKANHKGILPPKLGSVEIELVQTTMYLSEAMRTPDLKTGVHRTEKIPVRVPKLEAGEWILDTGSAASVYPHSSSTQADPAYEPGSHRQDLILHCKWSCASNFAPSFSTALISRWYTLLLDLSYTENSLQVRKKFKLVVPIKLGVMPSKLSVPDIGVQSVPDYSAFEHSRDNDGQLPNWDTLPEYSTNPTGITVR